MKEFFEFAQYSFFPHKLTGIKTNFRLFKHFDPHVIDFVSENLSKMDEQELTRILFFYAYNSVEA